jgi:hypothetical protein
MEVSERLPEIDRYAYATEEPKILPWKILTWFSWNPEGVRNMQSCKTRKPECQSEKIYVGRIADNKLSDLACLRGARSFGHRGFDVGVSLAPVSKIDVGDAFAAGDVEVHVESTSCRELAKY